MSGTPESTLADPDQVIADLQRQLAECKAELDQRTADVDSRGFRPTGNFRRIRMSQRIGPRIERGIPERIVNAEVDAVDALAHDALRAPQRINSLVSAS